MLMLVCDSETTGKIHIFNSCVAPSLAAHRVNAPEYLELGNTEQKNLEQVLKSVRNKINLPVHVNATCFDDKIRVIVNRRRCALQSAGQAMV